MPNPGIYDFRDPKVQWLPEQKKWLMTLATKDRISFYSSPNLKQWTKESEFGQKLGAHGGVWECPDLMSFDYQGGKKWVLLVSINPGGPNSGSATQYFMGDFNGKTFTPADTTTRWIDYGPDNYAGVTWSNTGNRHIFLGWMSNWNYANVVPTEKWRSAMTIPRELTLQPGTGGLPLASQPVKEVEALATDSTVLKDQNFDGDFDLSSKVKDLGSQYVLRFSTDELKDYTIKLSNGKNEQVLIGYDATKKQYFIDRTKAGKTNFKEGFAARAIAPRQTTAASSTVTLVTDKASAELFADGGLTNMTAIFFPNEDFNKLSMVGSGLKVKDLKIIELRSALK